MNDVRRLPPIQAVHFVWDMVYREPTCFFVRPSTGPKGACVVRVAFLMVFKENQQESHNVGVSETRRAHVVASLTVSLCRCVKVWRLAIASKTRQTPARSS